jgi:hypothetical protein
MEKALTPEDMMKRAEFIIEEAMKLRDGQDPFQPPEGSEITPEDYRAQKLLAYAKVVFIPAGNKGFITNQKSVDYCRQVIREYPDTIYVEEARKLLRSLSPENKKKYNITNEEMGL